MSNPAIECCGLSKRFPVRGLLPWASPTWVTALDAVDLEVESGTIHGLVGPNGSGKSTLLRIIATLVLPSAGSARVSGLDVVRQPLDVRRSIGFSTGEERSVYWRLTARQNLEFYAALYGLSSSTPRIGELLRLLELDGDADRPTSGFSNGMQRRLGLARALLHNPGVLLLDEPSRSLDPVSREHFHAILRRLRDGGRSVLMSTHDIEEVTSQCDQVTVLKDGHVAGTARSGEREAVDLLLGVPGARESGATR